MSMLFDLYWDWDSEIHCVFLDRNGCVLFNSMENTTGDGDGEGLGGLDLCGEDHGGGKLTTLHSTRVYEAFLCAVQ
jgi:hypothetical protein